MWDICELLYENPPFLEKIWGFLEGDGGRGPVLVGYMVKVAGGLLQKKPAEVFFFSFFSFLYFLYIFILIYILLSHFHFSFCSVINT